MRLAERMSRLGTETAFEVLAKAKALEAEGKEIIHLEIGEPDFDTPEHIKEAAIKALRDGKTGYCPAPGIRELREVIAADVGARRGLSVSPEEVVVTPGAKPIMYFVITALVDPGDEVLYPNPGFPIYESVINFVGGKAVPMPLREERNFSFDVDEFRALVTERTKLIIINSPQNPTGGVLSQRDLEVIAEVANERNIFILSDEVYNNILYEGTFTSIATLPGMRARTVILDGLSKTYAMTGWRLGYGVMPRELARHVERLTINTVSCTSHFSQYGAIAAITGPQEPVAAMVAEFRRRRDFIVAGLNRIKGVKCVQPQGAFYAFPNVTGTGIGSKELEQRLLEEAGVATLSGTAFGRYGDGYLRLSYANSLENIRKALERFAALVA
ncbi:MAG: pyridoxal phosphate-dependent aminotransferase [Candidatus Oleimicrobiaceae bacterium]